MTPIMLRHSIFSASRPRRGSAYVLVLGMGTLAMVAGLAAVTVGRIQLRGTSACNDVIQAEALAESAVEFALTRLTTDNNWRTTYSNGVETTPISFGGGTISFRLVDEIDSSFSDDPSEPIRIYGIGRYGKATRIYSVQAVGKDALTCLNAPLVVGGNINFNDSTVHGTGTTLVANGDIHGGYSPGATVYGNVEAGGTIHVEDADFNGTMKSGAAVTKRGMPNASVFDYYIANGTSIPYSTLSFGRTDLWLLSPASAPSGITPNPKGIYVIDCQNQKISITLCRIVGTLVVLNPGSGSAIGTASFGEPSSWVPAVANYPCLLVKGNLRLAFGWNSNAALYEANYLTNFNPAGTPYPYPAGATNATANDSYSSRVAGLVYVSGSLTGSNWHPKVDMLVVGGDYDVATDDIYPVYNGTYLANPPPGFTGMGQMVPVPGSWKWEKAP
jgi:hypothetical protein